MSGVEILATEKVVSEYSYNTSDFYLGFWIMVGIGIFISILIFFEKYLDIGTKIVCAIMILTFFVFFGVGTGTVAQETCKEPIAYKNRYKVTISDEVSMNEFNERYEIIDQEGKIYTVEEKE